MQGLNSIRNIRWLIYDNKHVDVAIVFITDRVEFCHRHYKLRPHWEFYELFMNSSWTIHELFMNSSYNSHWGNTVDPDQTLLYYLSDQGLQCLQKV